MTNKLDHDERFEELRNNLLKLARKLEVGDIGKAAAWGGAGVLIGLPKQRPHDGRDRYVGTKHAGALSWMLNELRDAFSGPGLIDHYNKIDFYGRLANAAIRCVKERDAKLPVCAAVLHEALVIAGELRNGTFESIQVAFDGEIL